MMSVPGSRSDAAAAADLITNGDERADIYSMFRLRQGYAGPCRRLRRVVDGATLDVGFTSGGAYDIQQELAWAGDSDVDLVRWYNQSAAAGRSRPLQLEATALAGAPRTRVDGAMVCLKGYPAIEMRPESWLLSTPAERIDHLGTIGLVWIGRALPRESFDCGLWSIHEEGIDDARCCQVDGFEHKLLRDRGIYYGRAGLYTHPHGDFTEASLIVSICAANAPWETLAWVNGSGRAVNYQGAVAGVGAGTPQLLGANIVHSFMVDGAGLCGPCALAARGLNAGGWIY